MISAHRHSGSLAGKRVLITGVEPDDDHASKVADRIAKTEER
jgi:hypothetical protein